MKDEALRLALEAYLCREMPAGTVIGDPKWWAAKIANAIKEALAQPEQEVDWKDQYEKQKRRAEMWLAKYEEVAGPVPKAIPMAQPQAIDVKLKDKNT